MTNYSVQQVAHEFQDIAKVNCLEDLPIGDCLGTRPAESLKGATHGTGSGATEALEIHRYQPQRTRRLMACKAGTGMVGLASALV